jgi:L-lactate utilization protein LutC
MNDYAAIVRTYTQLGSLDRESRLNLFVERLQEYGAVVYRCADARLIETIAHVLTALCKRRLLIPKDLPQEWLPPYPFEFVRDGGLSYDEIDRSEGVLTGCAVAIALTGTIVLRHSRGEGRRALTLIPDYHLCVVQYSYDILAAIDETKNPVANLACYTVPLIGASLCPGLLQVVEHLSLLSFLDHADRVIGIAPLAYVQAITGGSAGASLVKLVTFPGVLIADKFPETAAHELGHTYGLYPGTELYDPTTGDCLTGDHLANNIYWFDKPAEVVSPFQPGPFDNYMCAATFASPLANPPADNFFQKGFPDKWATTTDFVTVGAKYTNSTFDPETLIVSGNISQNGLATFDNYYRDPSGVLSQGQSSGQYQLQILSSSGVVLSSLYLLLDPQ